MPCYRPLEAWNVPYLSDGKWKRKPVFSRADVPHYDVAKKIDLPCGQCIGCRLERSRRWAVRIMHEAQMHEKNCFLTLTYDDDRLPSDLSLQLEDFQLFMKRLRRGSTSPLRFFHCGEYGCDEPESCVTPGCNHTARPHYHACLFGEDFTDDRIHYKKTKRGDVLYNSDRLTKDWGKGFAVIGDLTFESAAYVARYVLKKITGDEAESHYNGRKPEYTTMSRRPGIGATWYQRYKSEVYPSDSVVLRGQEMMPPPFYDKLLEKVDPELHKQIKRQRADVEYDPEKSASRRLMDRETVKQATIKNTLGRGSI